MPKLLPNSIFAGSILISTINKALFFISKIIFSFPSSKAPELARLWSVGVFMLGIHLPKYQINFLVLSC